MIKQRGYLPYPNVIPGLVPGIQLTSSAGASGEMDPGDPDLRRGRRAPG